MSFVQISRFHLFKNYYIGTGLITVVGTSFATLSTANAVRLLPHRLFVFLFRTYHYACAFLDLQCDVQRRNLPKHHCCRRNDYPRSLSRRLRQSSRNIAHLLIPRNRHVIRQSSNAQEIVPSHRDWYSHFDDRSVPYWRVGYCELGWRK
jgi:hypothetical protein